MRRRNSARVHSGYINRQIPLSSPNCPPPERDRNDHRPGSPEEKSEVAITRNHNDVWLDIIFLGPSSPNAAKLVSALGTLARTKLEDYHRKLVSFCCVAVVEGPFGMCRAAHHSTTRSDGRVDRHSSMVGLIMDKPRSLYLQDLAKAW